MSQEALVEIWKDWEAADDFTALEMLEDGRKFVFAHDVLFSHKACNVRLSESEENALKWAYVRGEVRFINPEFEERRIDYFQFEKANQAA